MTIEPTAGSSGLIERAKNMLLQPSKEWDRIATEPADINKIYIGYVLPLAAIAAICVTIGMLTLSGASMFGVRIGYTPVQAVLGGIIHLILNVVGIYIIALIAKALAPNFGSTPDQGQAHKLMAYSFTAALLAGVFSIHPALAILGLLGLYSFYLLYLGLPKLMNTPDDKRVGYLATLIVVGIVVFIVIGVVAGALQGAVAGVAGPRFSSIAPVTTTAPTTTTTEINVPGVGSVDVSSLSAGGAKAPDAAILQAFLSQNMPGGFTLTSTSSGGAMGTTQAEGVYQRGDARMTVTIIHMGEMGGLTSMAGAMGVSENRQDADGYSRTNTIDGRLITEEVSASARSAKYIIVGRGVAVSAEGNGITVDDARAAVEAVGIQRVEATGG